MISLILAVILGAGGLKYNNFTAPGAYHIHPPASVIPWTEPYLSLDGRVAVPCVFPTGKTATIVSVGQSQVANSIRDTSGAAVLYTAVSPNVIQLNIYDGKCYPAKDPLLGINGNGGTWMIRMADNLVASGKVDSVVLVPMGVGNTSAAQWAYAETPPHLFNIINVAALRIRDAGLSCTATVWNQGESDTRDGVTQASHSASLAKIIGEFSRTMPGCAFLVSQESYYYGAYSQAVVAAQMAAVNGTTVFAGPNFDSIPSSQRYDDTHLAGTGGVTAASLTAAAVINALGW